MAKQKERNEVEFLRAENRRLKSELRNAKKRIGRAQKKEYQYEDYLEDVKEIQIETEQVKVEYSKCPKCSHKLDFIDLTIRKIIKCSNCDYREVRKIK